MLSNAYFYYQLTRKYVILFGNLFNNISVVRKDKDDNSEIERFKVPLIYAPKEKYVARLFSDPDLARETQVTLPRMSFEIRSISYDASRKQNSLLRSAKGSSTTGVKSQYMGVPYDLQFELNIYTRHIDDGTHIVEQILPYFNPDYTVTIDSIEEMGFLKDIPIILTSVTNSIEHEGNFDAVRYVNWTLTFNMKAYYYGPISTPKIIRKVITNIFNDPALKVGYISRLYLTQPTDANSNYKLDDIVFQGDRYETSNAYGTVVAWNRDERLITLSGVQGQFKINNRVRAVSTNADYKIASVSETPIKLATITIEPDPIDALPNSDFGYTTTITEWPDTT